jgi:hypothetical protein
MKVESWKCDRCEKHITDPKTGYAILGNILYLNGGGLIGNNIENDVIVREVHYCTNCMLDLLGLKVGSVR